MSKTLRRTLPKVNVLASELFLSGENGKTKSMTATLRYAPISEKKMELVAKLVRGKTVAEALKLLEFTPKKAAGILHKLIRSALFNVVNNLGMPLEEAVNLRVDRIDVGRGPKLKRVRFASRARVHPYVKHRCFVRLVLDF